MGKRVFSILFVCLSVGGGLGYGWGWMPLPIRPQRYCDPASLVLNITTHFLSRARCSTTRFVCWMNGWTDVQTDNLEIHPCVLRDISPFGAAAQKTRLDTRHDSRGRSGRGGNAKAVCNLTSDAGSQYRCGRVGRGIQPPATPQHPFHTETYTLSI